MRRVVITNHGPGPISVDQEFRPTGELLANVESVHLVPNSTMTFELNPETTLSISEAEDVVPKTIDLADAGNPDSIPQ